jgi:ABC-type transport system involved in multi-copper enzyme maturation permease subunit
VPRLIVDLFRQEIESLKQELIGKAKDAGIGIGLLVAAAVFALFLLGVLIAAAILGLATVLPAWAAALIVAGVLLIITVVLALVGIASLKRGMPPAPTQTIESIKDDVRVIKGTSRRRSTP